MNQQRALPLGSAILLFALLLGSVLLIPALSRPALQAQETCGTAPLPRLAVGGHAVVTISEGETLRLREDPGLDGAATGSLDPRQEVDILAGPVCADNYYWWHIQTSTGLTGWVAEGQPAFYFLTQTRAPVPTADTGDTTCENVLPPVGAPGDHVTVTHAGEPLEARALPAQEAGINSTWWAGSTFTLLEGPSCGNGIWWWRVTLPDDRTTAWVPQGDSTQYYLIVVTPTAPPTATVTQTATATPTLTTTPSATVPPSDTATATEPPTSTVPPSNTPTVTPTVTPSNTPRPTSTPRPSLTPSPTLDALCWSAPLPRLTAGDNAQVAQVIGGLRLRALPAVGAGEIALLNRGTAITLLEGPLCNTGYYWYQVELSDGRTGWVAEGDADTYWLDPVAAEAPLAERACLAWSDNHGLYLTVNGEQFNLPEATTGGHTTIMAFSPNGRFLAANQRQPNSAAANGLAIYDLTTGEVIGAAPATTFDATAAVQAITIHWLPDSSGLVMTDLAQEEPLNQLVMLPDQVSPLPLENWQTTAITADGQLILLRPADWGAALYDLATETLTTIQPPAAAPRSGESFTTLALLTTEEIVLLFGNTSADETTLHWASTVALPDGEVEHAPFEQPFSQIAWAADESQVAYTLASGSLWLAQSLADGGNLLVPYSAGEVAGLRFSWSLTGQALLYANVYEPNTPPSVLDLTTNTSVVLEPLDETSLWTYRWLSGTTLLAATDNTSQALVNQPTDESFWLLDPIEGTQSHLLTLENTVLGGTAIQPDGCFSPME